MASSKQLAGLVGPTIVAVIASEFPLVQPHLYDEQIPTVVYLSGVLMFVAGLAIVRTHNRWVWDWTVLVTLAGWFSATLACSGCSRPAPTNGAPRALHRSSKPQSPRLDAVGIWRM